VPHVGRLLVDVTSRVTRLLVDVTSPTNRPTALRRTAAVRCDAVRGAWLLYDGGVANARATVWPRCTPPDTSAPHPHLASRRTAAAACV
jgi:hypothetical protein